jgi:hypothetical protein
MARGLRGYRTVIASLTVIVLVGAALWWYSGSGELVLGKVMLGLAIGVGVGFLTMVVHLSRPAAQALVTATALRGRRYLVPGELPPPPTNFVGREALQTELTRLIKRRSARSRRGRW